MRAEPEFDEFVRERYPQLLRYAVMLTGRQWDAEEVVQEALLRCLKRWRRVPAENAVAYVRKAIYHEFLRAAKKATPVAPEEIAEQLDLTDVAGSVASRDHVLLVLQKLPPRQRAAVVARFVLDLSEAQAAVELGCTVGTVKSLTSRGVARMKELWAADEAVVGGWPGVDRESGRRGT
ncbi:MULTISPECIES: SigE family RNA polymerase sigma factor [Actinokineospora]|uniref:DNA-directed RNA polymerase sigma-70 factor n=1 Tax=Actinokineospora fastidiosa TaxID=1816 RepID=A0A918G7Y2_9PSEU|nr:MULTISPECIES: SigE family RNA polymerase sigma factor [Actinokineospora]UVS82216.1 RNA polymerase sigma-E factor [Actinokineospora sp. UTMC 2448]GGS22838.1 DNA-directed RNA polymerase sigma-70 factor [Actinokineospora fastidiosa]